MRIDEEQGGTMSSIVFDFDGVIADTPRFGVQLIRKWHGVEIPLHLYRKTRIDEAGFSVEDFMAMKHRLYNEEWPINPMPGALHHIQQLRKGHGHSVRVVTSRSGAYLERAQSLLARYDLGDLQIIGVGKDTPKTEACHGADLFVDDDVNKLIPLRGSVKHLILFSWPYNEADEVPKGIVRLRNWPGIYDYIFHEVV